MLQQQSAPFLRHLGDGLFDSRQLGMYQGGQGSTRHAAERHIVRDAQAVLLDDALGSQDSGLRKSEDGVKRHPLGQILLHHPTALFGRQCRQQDIMRLVLDMKLLKRITITSQPFITVADIRRTGNMDDVLVTLAQQSLNHEKRHDIIVHAHLGSPDPLHGSVKKHDGDASLYHLII